MVRDILPELYIILYHPVPRKRDLDKTFYHLNSLIFF